MSQEITLYQKCPVCNGTGMHDPAGGPGPGATPCTNRDCAGTGYITFGKCTFDPGLDDLATDHVDIRQDIADAKEVIDEIKTIVE